MLFSIVGKDLLSDVITNTFDKDHFINNVDTLHRLPNLTLSRDKLSNFKEECNFKIVRDQDKADIIVVGEKTTSKMISNTWNELNPLDKVKSYIEHRNYKLNSED